VDDTRRGEETVLNQPLDQLRPEAGKLRERFPADFMFQLGREEAASLRSQIVTLEMPSPWHRAET